MKPEQLTSIRQKLGEPLDTVNTDTLRRQLATRASWQAELSVAFREAEEQLGITKGKLFNPSLSSEDKRKYAIEHLIAPYARTAGEYSDLLRIISEQLVLGAAILQSLVK